MIVRAADPERDAAACAAIYAPSVDPGLASFETEPPGAEEITARIAAAHAWLVAEDGGAVVAFAYAGPFHVRAAYRWAATVSVYVADTHHRRGLGRQLYEALFAVLREQGMRWACAGITLPNAASVALHEALGFERSGVFRQIGYKAGDWRDVGWWQLDLA